MQDFLPFFSPSCHITVTLFFLCISFHIFWIVIFLLEKILICSLSKSSEVTTFENNTGVHFFKINDGHILILGHYLIFLKIAIFPFIFMLKLLQMSPPQLLLAVTTLLSSQ